MSSTTTEDPIVHCIYESNTGTWQYIVADPATKRAAIIDPVLDFDPAKNEISTAAADALLSVVKGEGYVVDVLLETHLHADHISAASYLRNRLGEAQGEKPEVGIGEGIEGMQKLFGERFGVPEEEYSNSFTRTFPENASFPLGTLQVRVLHLPGHTPDHIGYQIGRNVFTGDSIFPPDLGSARCDFPSGSASALWNSMQRLLSLPSDYKLYSGHDYPPSDRVTDDGVGKPRAYATVAEHRLRNKHVKEGTEEAKFVEWRMERDRGLSQPKLINQALQFNIRAGKMPRRSRAGDCLVHVPVKMPGVLAADAAA